jgi:hypothetical protein
MTKDELTTDTNVAFKIKVHVDGKTKWSPLLSFTKVHGEYLFFKPVEDTLSTLTHEIIQVYLGSESCLADAKKFIQCKFYGEWVKAPHVCGKDCPL